MLDIWQHWCVPESGAGPADAGHDLDDGVAAPGAPPVHAHPRVDALLSQLRFREDSIGCFLCSTNRADKKSQVRKCLGFLTADFLSSLAYESDEHKP